MLYINSRKFWDLSLARRRADLGFIFFIFRLSISRLGDTEVF